MGNLWRFFNYICGDPPEPYKEWEQHQAFTTLEKVEKYLPKYWGHQIDFLTSQFFLTLSDGNKLARVYFD